MPLPVPRLDDRTFAELVREGESLIPRHGGEWTDRNASDPGVTLVELFAWLTETAIYQVDRVPPASVEAYLRLLGECRAVHADGARETVDEALSRSVRALGEARRAVTAAEYEALALEPDPGAPAAVARARFLRLTGGTCLTPADFRARQQTPPPATTAGEGETTALVIVPHDRVSERPAPSEALVERVFRRVAERRVLATRVRVFGPAYVTVGVRAVVARRRGSGLTPERVRAEVVRFLSPLEGGEDGRGWPFGRSVYLSELFQLLEGMPAVDHVESLAVLTAAGVPAAEVPLPPYGLVHAPRAGLEVRVEEVR